MKNTKNKRRGRFKNSLLYGWGKATLYALSIFLIIRLLAFQTCFITTSSMLGALEPGDWVLINKISFGARMPITPIGLPSILSTNKSNNESYLSFFTIPYCRIPGYSRIHRSDIIAFNYPLDEDNPIDRKSVLVKRCVGIPGDTLEIIKNGLLVNHQKLEISSAQFEYLVKVKGKKINDNLLVKLKIYEGGEISNYGEYKLFMSKLVADSLRKDKTIASVTQEKNFLHSGKNYTYPQELKSGWTLDNYGPIIIPKKRFKVILNNFNLSVYREVIEKHEGCKVMVANDSVYINNIYSTYYIFKHNYYFFLDDNRDNAKDSRHWGFVPENHIIGKTPVIIGSFDPSKSGLSKIRWNRTAKFIK